MRPVRRVASRVVMWVVAGAGCWSASAPARTAAAEPDRSQGLAGSLTLTASAGQLGHEPLYNLRLAYFPTPKLGMEATLAHNPSQRVHAVLHYANADFLPGRYRFLWPFVTAGLGTIEVFPGSALNAPPVTKLLANAGGGMYFVLRDDVALRVEARSFTVFDQQEAHRGAYGYAEWSAGLTFYRVLSRPETSETGAAP